MPRLQVFDWRRRIPRFLSYYFDQGDARVCWAAAAVAAVEANVLIHHKRCMRLSLQQILDWCPDFDGIGGGHSFLALEYMRENGITTEADYPYNGKLNQLLRSLKERVRPVVRVESFRLITCDDISEQRLICELQHGPVVVVFYVSEQFERFRGSNILTEGIVSVSDLPEQWVNDPWNEDILDFCDVEDSSSDDSVDAEGHEVLIVGYGTSRRNVPYWIIRNTFGSEWGDRGHAKLHRKFTKSFVRALVVDQTSLVNVGSPVTREKGKSKHVAAKREKKGKGMGATNRRQLFALQCGATSGFEDPEFLPGREASIIYKGNLIGTFGIVHPEVLENHYLENEVESYPEIMSASIEQSSPELPDFSFDSNDDAVPVQSMLKEPHNILKCIPRCTTHLKTIISFGLFSEAQEKEADEFGVSGFSLDEFTLLGNQDHELPPKDKNNTCTIMYTSRTTGEPKGVVLNNNAFMAEVLSTDQVLMLTDKEMTGEDTYFSFLPLAHVYDQILVTYCIYKGSSIGFWQSDVRYLIEDLTELKPAVFSGVTRVSVKIYAGAMQKISSSGTLKRTFFQVAYNYKLRNLEKGFKQHEAAPFLDKLVFDKIKQAFGGRVRLLLSGLTECCSRCFTSMANVFPMMGTVGVPITSIETRLESVLELGYDALGDVPRGEICLRGLTLFTGYHKRDDLTHWFHTGDIGELQPNGAMKIIDRKKNIFKLSQGEYVAAESLESIYSRCPLIAAIWVYGNSFESFLVGVVVPERKGLEDWAMKNNETGEFKLLCENPKARKYVLDELNRIAKEHQLRGFEMLKAVHFEGFDHSNF